MDKTVVPLGMADVLVPYSEIVQTAWVRRRGEGGDRLVRGGELMPNPLVNTSPDGNSGGITACLLVKSAAWGLFPHKASVPLELLRSCPKS